MVFYLTAARSDPSRCQLVKLTYSFTAPTSTTGHYILSERALNKVTMTQAYTAKMNTSMRKAHVANECRNAKEIDPFRARFIYQDLLDLKWILQ